MHTWQLLAAVLVSIIHRNFARATESLGCCKKSFAQLAQRVGGQVWLLAEAARPGVAVLVGAVVGGHHDADDLPADRLVKKDAQLVDDVLVRLTLD